VTEELTTIRERLARVETTLEHLGDQISAAVARLDAARCQKEKDRGGHIIVPVAVIVGLMELITQLVQRALG
jgi:hypothetical protein